MADYKSPFSPEFLDEEQQQLGILSQMLPSPRGPGVTSQFTPESLATEAEDRTRNIFSDRFDTELAAQEPTPSAPVFSGVMGGTPGPAPDYLQNLLGKVYGQESGEDALKQAQEQQRQLQLIGGLGIAGSQVGAAIAGIKPQTQVQEGIIERSGQPVKDILTRREAKVREIETGLKISDLENKEKRRDPGSAVSAAFRNMAVTFNPKLGQMPGFNKMSAEDIKEQHPMIEAAMRFDAMKGLAGEKAEEKKQTKIDKELKDFTKGMEQAYTGKVGSPLGRAQNAIRAGQNLQALAYSGTPLDKIPPELARDFIGGVDSMIRGGQTSAETIRELMPSTVQMKGAKIWQWITGEPTGARLGKFLELFLDVAEREEAVASRQIADYQARHAASYRHLQGVPEFENKLDSLGIRELFEKARVGKKVDTAGEYIKSLKEKTTSRGPVKGAPEIGFIKDNYRFKGGDPRKEENWEQLK